MRTHFLGLSVFLLVVGITTSSVVGEYALRDGDTVVFLGDSITAARTYGKIVENYTLLRYPTRKVRFINSGWGGDTAAGGLKRLERDVFAHGATVLIVAYGINDIGWGTKADDEHKTLYLDAVREIVAQCRSRNVRVFLCSAAVTAADPDRSETDYLQRMCDEGMALARSLGAESIDVQRTMRRIQKRIVEANAHRKEKDPPDSLHVADGVHLNDLGQLAMAFAILKGLEAPAEVSAATLDASALSSIETQGCRISNVTGADGRLEFDRLDDGLPINFGIFGALQFRFIPIPDELNRYMITVRNLAQGRYAIEVDGRGLGTFPSEQLARGLNIASATSNAWEPGGPWDAQAGLLKQVTDARSELMQADRMTRQYLPDSNHRKESEPQFRAIDTDLQSLQRTLARPSTYHFVVRRAE